MKYRLVELLQCISCRGDMAISTITEEARSSDSISSFQCRSYCSLNRTSQIPEPAHCADCGQRDILAGVLMCQDCGREFSIVQSIPWLFETAPDFPGTVLSKTSTLYSHLWNTTSPSAESTASSHLDGVQAALGEPVVQGKLGLDVGSGCGSDTALMASRNPSTEIISLDISEGVYETKRRTARLGNVYIIRASALSIPVKSAMCDFAYSFGVLHHTADPPGALYEVVRVLKPSGRFAVYLYQDHSGNPWKSIPLKLVAVLRRVTTKLNTRVLSGLCYLISPLIVLVFSVPARLMRRFNATKALAAQMPFNFGTSPFSVHGDLVDRFGAPIEVRYSQHSLVMFLQSGGLCDIVTNQIKATAGWVARGVKPSPSRR